jgi:hypothetical protein
LILCEGAKTEPLYFRAFPHSKVFSVTVHGEGMNTDSLVERAKTRKHQAERRKQPFNEVWCVFDRDSFSISNFNRALRLGESYGIRIAYSNQAFELWYLLHFDFHTSSIDRRRYKAMLTSRLGLPYKKNHPDIYKILESRQAGAIRNAQALLSHHPAGNPYINDPSTTVHLLVQRLNLMA